MPELPEVEIAARALRRWLVGRRITAVTVQDARIVVGDAGGLARGLLGRSVRSIDRKGKRLRLSLDDERLVFVGLGMTGKWVRRPSRAPSERFEKLRLRLKNTLHQRSSVRLVDPRLLASLELRADDSPGWRALGPDPLADGVDTALLHRALQRRAGPIKVNLMDQSVLAGIGNIQAIEALFLARIDPRTPSNALDMKKVNRLALAITESIARTLAHESEGELTYVGEAGAPNPFIIYGRAGEPCPRCGTKLVRLVQAGRGTTWCPSCQT
jgi:formamidopyrimidine-DNA glycosylase